MKIYQRFFLFSFLVAVLFLSVACSSSSTTTATTTPTGQATLTGTLLQPNGTDPVPGALVYVAASSSASLVKALTTPSTRLGNFGNFLINWFKLFKKIGGWVTRKESNLRLIGRRLITPRFF